MTNEHKEQRERFAVNYRRPHGRAHPPGEVQHLADCINAWRGGALAVNHQELHFTFEEQRAGWLLNVENRLQHSRQFRPYRHTGPADNPFVWQTFQLIPSADDVCANQDDLALLLLLVEQVRGAEPPAGGAMIAVAEPIDPRDSDGWTDAVSRQGVRPPSYAEGYLLSTHWQLLQEERLTGTCDRCDRAEPTHLHHVSYQRLGAESELDTRELCARCHRREHPRTFQKAA